MVIFIAMIHPVKTYLFLCTFVIGVASPAQPSNTTDSLEQLLERRTLSDRQRIDILIQLEAAYIQSDTTKVTSYAKEAIGLARNLGDNASIIDAYFHWGWSKLRSGRRTQAVHSFRKAIVIGVEDTEVSAGAPMNALGVYYLMISEFDSAAYYLERAIAKSETFEEYDNVASSYNYLGVIQDQLGRPLVAQEYYQKALEVYTRLNDKQGLAIVYNSIGNNFYMLGKYPEALAQYISSAAIKKELGDERGLSKAYNNIGSIYDRQGNREEALKYYYQSLAIKERLNDKRGLASTYGNISNIIKNYDSLEKAEDYLEKALELYQEIDYKLGAARILSMFGAHHNFLKDYQTALAYYEESAALGKRLGAVQVYDNSIIKKGEQLFELGKYREAEAAFAEGLTIAQENDWENNIINSSQFLTDIYEKLGDHRRALEAHRIFKQASDSLNNRENIVKITRLQAEYEFQQEKDSLALVQERQQLSFEAELNERKSFQTSLSIILGMAFIVIVAIFLFNRRLSVLNEEISTQNAELESLNKMKNRFFSIIAHDLRNPVGIMIGWNHILKNHLTEKYTIKDDGLVQDIFGHLEKSSGQVLNLLDLLLKWAMKEEGVIKYKPEFVNLKEAVEENIHSFDANAEMKNILLKSEVGDELKAWVDKNSFMTILRNLTGNALKFTPDGGEVMVSASQNNGSVQIEIKDTGVGISEDKIGKLFELDRAKVSNGTKGEKGTGLGLKLVYDFVKMNKGKIDVISELNVGTSFRVELPASNLN